MTYRQGVEYVEYIGPTLAPTGGRWIVPAGPWERAVVVACRSCGGRGAERGCNACGNSGTREIRRNQP